jgi:uncharacterized membrane protein
MKKIVGTSMTRIYRNTAIAILACLCVALYLVPSAAAAQNSTSITVEVYTNGDAHWTTVDDIPLNSSADIAAWDATSANNIGNYTVDFQTQMVNYIDKISSDIGRTMLVEDVNVTVGRSSPYEVSDNDTVNYGVITYDFNWTGFAAVNGNDIDIGDAFEDGFLLDHGDSITFILPAGYTITSVSPAYDEIKRAYQPQITWTGSSINNTDPTIRLFPSGEPSITLSKTVTTAAGPDWWMLIPVALIAAIAGFGIASIVLRRHKPEAPTELPPLVEYQPIPDAGTVEAPSPAPVKPEERYLSDEERVVKYLEEAGGQMFQSDLVKRTDFSKSKLSMVLSELKEKGTIIKIKKGKENLIRLNRSPPGENKEGPEK